MVPTDCEPNIPSNLHTCNPAYLLEILTGGGNI